LLKTQVATNFLTLIVSISVLVDSNKIFVRNNSNIHNGAKLTLFLPPHHDIEELYFSVFWCIFCWNIIFWFVGLSHLYMLLHNDDQTNETLINEQLELSKDREQKNGLNTKFNSYTNRQIAMDSMAFIISIFMLGLSVSSFFINRIHCADIPLFQLADSPMCSLLISIISTSGSNQYKGIKKMGELLFVSFTLSLAIAYFVHEFQNADMYSGKREWLSPDVYSSVFDSFANKTTKITPAFLFSESNGETFSNSFKHQFYQCSLTGHVISMLTVSNGSAYWILKCFQYFETFCNKNKVTFC
jgi:hypothetical protein